MLANQHIVVVAAVAALPHAGGVGRYGPAGPRHGQARQWGRGRQRENQQEHGGAPISYIPLNRPGYDISALLSAGKLAVCRRPPMADSSERFEVATPPTPGTEVELFGLVQNPKLNGKRGRVVDAPKGTKQPASGRVLVRVPGEAKPKSFKLSNLRKITPEPAAPGPRAAMAQPHATEMAYVTAMQEVNKTGLKAKFYAWATDKWEQFERPNPTAKATFKHEALVAQRGFDNAVKIAEATNGTLQMYIGWAFDPQFGKSFGFEHAWNVGPDGKVYDYSPKWEEVANAFYCGVPIPLYVAKRALALGDVDFFHAVETILFPSKPTKNLHNPDWDDYIKFIKDQGKTPVDIAPPEIVDHLKELDSPHDQLAHIGIWWQHRLERMFTAVGLTVETIYYPAEACIRLLVPRNRSVLDPRDLHPEPDYTSDQYAAALHTKFAPYLKWDLNFGPCGDTTRVGFRFGLPDTRAQESRIIDALAEGTMQLPDAPWPFEDAAPDAARHRPLLLAMASTMVMYPQCTMVTPELLERFVAAGGRLDAPDSNGLFPIHTVKTGPLCKVLLNQNCDPNQMGQRSNERPLFKMCAGGADTDCVRALLDAGAVVDERDKETGKTALHEAVQRSYTTTELLLQRGADPVAKQRVRRGGELVLVSPLHLAIDGGLGASEIAELLLSYDSRVLSEDCIDAGSGLTPLMMAIGKPHIDLAMVSFLLQHAGELLLNRKLINGISALNIALNKDSIDCVALLLENGATFTRDHLYKYIRKRNAGPDVVPMLDKLAFYDVLQDPELDLPHSALFQQPLVESVREAVRSKGVNTQLPATGYTVLHSVAANGLAEYKFSDGECRRLTKMLLSENANPNVCNVFGVPPLVAAVMSNNTGVVAVLLGATTLELSAAEPPWSLLDMTPLHAAVYFGASEEIVKALVKRDPSAVNALNLSRQTPLSLAIAEEDVRSCQILFGVEGVKLLNPDIATKIPAAVRATGNQDIKELFAAAMRRSLGGSAAAPAAAAPVTVAVQKLPRVITIQELKEAGGLRLKQLVYVQVENGTFVSPEDSSTIDFTHNDEGRIFKGAWGGRTVQLQRSSDGNSFKLKDSTSRTSDDVELLPIGDPALDPVRTVLEERNRRLAPNSPKRVVSRKVVPREQMPLVPPLPPPALVIFVWLQSTKGAVQNQLDLDARGDSLKTVLDELNLTSERLNASENLTKELIKGIRNIGRPNHREVTALTEANLFTPSNLKKFKAIVTEHFMSPPRDTATFYKVALTRMVRAVVMQLQNDSYVVWGYAYHVKGRGNRFYTLRGVPSEVTKLLTSPDSITLAAFVDLA